MATYFDFEKKHAHINKDDIYVKHGEVRDDKLVLEYSVEGMDPLSVSLSAFDKMTYIDDAEFKDNNLILKHNIRIPDLSVNLSSLDKHVSEVKKADDDNALSLCFSDGTFISVDTTKFAEDYYVTSCYVDGNNLVLLRNNGLAPLVADLDKFNTHIESWEIIGNDLVLRYNDETPALSVALDRFHKHIDKMQIDDCDQLTLRYADDVAAPLSADLSRYTRNWFVNDADLCGDVIVLKRNSADAGEDLSVDASSLNNYIANANIVNSTLVLSYNTDRLAPLSIDTCQLKVLDTYISAIELDDKDNLVFDYNRADVMAKAVCLHKFAKNDYIKSGSYNEDTHYLTLNYNNPDEKDPLSIYIPASSAPAIDDTYVSNGRFDADDKSLVLSYNKDRSDIRIKMDVLSAISFDAADDTSVLSIAETVQQIVEAFGGNADVKKQQLMSTTFAAGSKSDVDHYVASGKFDVDSKKLIFNYNTEFAPLAIDLNVLSGMNFVAKPTTKMREIADAIKQIVEAFGGNR